MDSRQRTSMYLRWKSSLYNRLQIFITTESSSIVSCLPDQLNPERLDSISDHHLPAAPQALKWQVPRKSHRWSMFVNLGLSLRIEFFEKIVQDERLCVFEVQFWLCIAFFNSPFHITLLLLLIGHDPLSDFFSSFHFVHLHSREQLGANHNLSCHYRKRGSASYIVRQWLLWEGERERERERETPVTSLISRWNREWSCIWLPRRRVDPTRRRVLILDLSLSSARTSKCIVKTRSLALERSIEQQGRVIDERRWGSGSFAFAGQTAVDHPAAFCWHASSKKNRPSWCLFPFRMAMVLPLRTAWIADILSQASLRDVDNAVGSVVAETGRDIGTTLRHDWAIFSSMPLTSEVRLNRLQGHRRQPIARSGKFVRRAYSRRALDCAYAFSHRAQCTKTTLLQTW